MEEQHADQIPRDTEQRFIGGTRVLLVKRYNGQKRLPPPPSPLLPESSGVESEDQPKRYLLERRVSIPPVSDCDTKETTEPKTVKTRTKRRRNVDTTTAAIGIFGGFAAAAVGLWFYTKNSDEQTFE